MHGVGDISGAVRRALPVEDGTVSFLEWEGPSAAPILVFLHANGFHARTYRTVLAPLADRFRIIAPDMRGHGLTSLAADLPKAGWTTYRDDLLRFIDKLGVRPAVLAGHSMGATVSLMAAGARPDIAHALVLAEPVLQPDRVAAYALFARSFGLADRLLPRVGPAARRRSHFPSRADALKAYTGRGAFRSWPETAVADYVEGGLVADDGQFRLACAPQWESRLFSMFPFGLARLGRRVRIPVTILGAGEHSSAIDSVVDGFVRRNRQARFLRVPGTSHFLPLEQPEIFRAEVLNALGQMLPASALRSSPSVE